MEKENLNNSDIVINKAKKFSSELYNPIKCKLCEKEFSLSLNLPRILVQCGHSFCTLCLASFLRNNKIYCPLCESLLEKINDLDDLPVNQSIFNLLQNKSKKDYNSNIVIKSKDIEYNNCDIHKNKINNFYCNFHQNRICKQCYNLKHMNSKCVVIEIKKKN